jgi:hypothetical protein
MTTPEDDPSAEAPSTDTRAVLVSLYKKFVWADFLRRKYERYRDRDAEFMRVGLEEKKVGSFEEAFEADMYMCLWFSVLYVVIEGWPTLRLKFDKLTPLLRSNNKNLLKDFRDATFHPTDWRDERFDALIQLGKASYDWVVAVTDAFREFFEPAAQIDRAARRRK